MAVRLRLKRTGRRNRPFYRIGAFTHTARRDGAPVEDLGWYDPLVRERDKSFQLDRADDIQQGALITHEGEVTHARTRDALQKGAA